MQRRVIEVLCLDWKLMRKVLIDSIFIAASPNLALCYIEKHNWSPNILITCMNEN